MGATPMVVPIHRLLERKALLQKGTKFFHAEVQPLYKTPHYNTDLDITWLYYGSQFFNMEFYQKI